MDPDVAELQLPPEPASVARARGFVLDSVGDHSTRLGQDLELLTSELATNAVLHAGTPFTVRVRRGSGTVHVEVEDRSATLPHRKRYGPAATVGRGLLLIEAISDRWGVRSSGGGKTVWAELADGDDHGA